MKKIILSFIAVTLFWSNHLICDLFCKDDLEKWWPMRVNIYAVLFGLCMYISKIKEQNKTSDFLILTGIGLCASDIIDRIIFNSNKFQIIDILMCAVSIYYAASKTFFKNK